MPNDHPSENLDKYMMRLPDGLRVRIKVAAKAHRRSMNAEMVAALLEAFPEPEPGVDAEIVNAATEVLNSWEQALTAFGQDPAADPKIAKLRGLLEQLAGGTDA